MNELDEAIEMLQQNYEEAQKHEQVLSPIAYALYYTWKEFDKRELKRVHKLWKEKKNDC